GASRESSARLQRAKKEQWISTSTWDKIDQRKGIKKKLLTTKSPRLKERLSREYSQKDKEVKRSTRIDKRTYIGNLAEDAEAAARRKDMKSLYQITKKLKGDTGPNQNFPLKDADGKIITVEKEKIERWKEHFQQVLNRAVPPRLADIPEAADDLEINLDQITEAEVREAIKAQKNGKAPGSDSVCAEMLKADEQETPRILCQIFQRIWDEEDTPDDWKESLWRILRHYGIPQKMVNVIKILYTDVQFQVACNSHMSDSFSVKSGVKQGCILSPFLFTLAIDWLMIETTKNGNSGIRWTLTSILEDLDYADNIGLLSNRHKDMQEKMDKLTRTAPQIGLKLNTTKTKLMRINNKTDNPITINNINNSEALEDVQDFAYLGSKITTDGDSAKDATARIRKASQTFAMLKPIWKSKQLRLETK
ncbi:hypothetical protein LSAT2_015232, partial [Lamellibrachia satsuma]